jgi:hypothetical protein
MLVTWPRNLPPTGYFVQQLLHAERDALRLGIDLDDLHFDGVADIQHLRRMRDPLPAHVGDMKQTVDPAEIDEGAVIGDVLDDAFAHFAFLQLSDDFGPFAGARFFEDGAPRHDDVSTRAIHLQDLERLDDVHQRSDIAHGANVHLATGQEGACASEIDREAALDPSDQRAVHGLAGREILLEARPGLFAAGLLSADDSVAQSVFDSVQVDLDDIACLGAGSVGVDQEFAQRDAALGFEADVHDDEIMLHGHDGGRDDPALHHPSRGHALVQERGEILARRVQGGLVHELSKYFRSAPADGLRRFGPATRMRRGPRVSDRDGGNGEDPPP